MADTQERRDDGGATRFASAKRFALVSPITGSHVILSKTRPTILKPSFLTCINCSFIGLLLPEETPLQIVTVLQSAALLFARSGWQRSAGGTALENTSDLVSVCGCVGGVLGPAGAGPRQSPPPGLARTDHTPPGPATPCQQLSLRFPTAAGYCCIPETIS